MSKNWRRFLRNLAAVTALGAFVWATDNGLAWLSGHPAAMKQMLQSEAGRLALFGAAFVVIGAVVLKITMRLHRISFEFAKSQLDGLRLLGDPLISEDNAAAYYAVLEAAPLSGPSKRKQSFVFVTEQNGKQWMKVCHVAHRVGRRLKPFSYRATRLNCDLQFVFDIDGDPTKIADATENLPLSDTTHLAIALLAGDAADDLREKYGPSAVAYLRDTVVPWLKFKSLEPPPVEMPPAGLTLTRVDIVLNLSRFRKFNFSVDLGTDQTLLSNQLFETAVKLPNIRYIAARA